MKRIFVLFIFSLFLYALSAQTIYHYKQVACVDLKTEEKQAKSGAYMHIIFTSSMAYLCSEDGKIKEEEEEIDIDNAFRKEKKYGNQYHFSFVRCENGMNVYSAHYYYLKRTYSSGFGPFPAMCNTIYDIDTYRYLYVSSNKRRINVSVDTKFMRENGRSGSVDIYELYDTDVVGQTKTNSISPGKLTEMY